MARRRGPSLYKAAMASKRQAAFQDALRQHNEAVVKSANEALRSLLGDPAAHFSEEVLGAHEAEVRRGALLAIANFLNSRGTLDSLAHSLRDRRQGRLASDRKDKAAARNEVIALVVRKHPKATWKAVVKILIQRHIARELEDGALVIEGHEDMPIAHGSLATTISRIKRTCLASAI